MIPRPPSSTRTSTLFPSTTLCLSNSPLGRTSMQFMQLNPVPVAWVEFLDDMRSGLIDGMETWTTACTAFNLAPVVSHYVGLNFIPGVEHTAIRTQTIDKLGSDLAEQMFEDAYMAQTTDRKSVWEGYRVSIRYNFGGTRNLKEKNKH